MRATGKKWVILLGSLLLLVASLLYYSGFPSESASGEIPARITSHENLDALQHSEKNLPQPLEAPEVSDIQVRIHDYYIRALARERTTEVASLHEMYREFIEVGGGISAPQIIEMTAKIEYEDVEDIQSDDFFHLIVEDIFSKKATPNDVLLAFSSAEKSSNISVKSRLARLSISLDGRRDFEPVFQKVFSNLSSNAENEALLISAATLLASVAGAESTLMLFNEVSDTNSTKSLAAMNAIRSIRDIRSMTTLELIISDPSYSPRKKRLATEVLSKLDVDEAAADISR